MGILDTFKNMLNSGVDERGFTELGKKNFPELRAASARGANTAKGAETVEKQGMFRSMKDAGFLKKAAGFLKGGGGLATAAAVFDTATTDTEDYRKRFGLAPGSGDDSIAEDTGVRALGFMSDFANALSFGQLGKLYRDQEDKGGFSLFESPAAAGERNYKNAQANPSTPAAAAAAAPAATPAGQEDLGNGMFKTTVNGRPMYTDNPARALAEAKNIAAMPFAEAGVGGTDASAGAGQQTVVGFDGVRRIDTRGNPSEYGGGVTIGSSSDPAVGGGGAGFQQNQEFASMMKSLGFGGRADLTVKSPLYQQKIFSRLLESKMDNDTRLEVAKLGLVGDQQKLMAGLQAGELGFERDKVLKMMGIEGDGAIKMLEADLASKDPSKVNLAQTRLLTAVQPWLVAKNKQELAPGQLRTAMTQAGFSKETARALDPPQPITVGKDKVPALLDQLGLPMSADSLAKARKMVADANDLTEDEVTLEGM